MTETPRTRSITPLATINDRLRALANEYEPRVADLLLAIPRLPVDPHEILSALRALACSPTGALGPPRLDDRDRKRILQLVTLGMLALCALPSDPEAPEEDPPSTVPATQREGEPSTDPAPPPAAKALRYGLVRLHAPPATAAAPSPSGRRGRRYELDGEMLTVREIADRLDLTAETVRNKLAVGWTAAEIRAGGRGARAPRPAFLDEPQRKRRWRRLGKTGRAA